jgi:hypothetical protein
MNEVAQASSAAVSASLVGSHGRSLPGVSIAVFASVSAAFMYASVCSGETPSAEALLSKPERTSSGGKASAGCVVSPKRSRTVALYSKRVRRLTGEADTVAAPPHKPGSMLLAPISPMQPGPTTSTSSSGRTPRRRGHPMRRA